MTKESHGVLMYLCKFLSHIATYKELNKMSAENLSMVFGHNFLREKADSSAEEILNSSAKVQRFVSILLENVDWFFGDSVFKIQI